MSGDTTSSQIEPPAAASPGSPSTVSTLNRSATPENPTSTAIYPQQSQTLIGTQSATVTPGIGAQSATVTPGIGAQSTTATSITTTAQTPGVIAGIAIGVIISLTLCALLALFLYRRRRRRNAHNSGDPDVAVNNAPSQNQAAWHEQPKDDESMLRLYKEADGRLTDHVLNFYVSSDGETYGDEISELSKDARRDFEIRVSKLVQLLPRQDSRMFVLRAIIANRVMRAASEEAEAQKTASTTPNQGVSDSNSRDNMILRLAQVAHDETKAFAIPSSNIEARLHSMETVVRTAVEFALTMAKQPTAFEFVWAFPTSEGASGRAELDPQTMEVVYQAREDQSAAAEVRATVFPGLRKWWKGEESLLAKTQVLLY